MTRRLLPPALALVLLASTAHADTRPGVQVSFTGLTVARAGQPINAQATIRASVPVTLKEFAAVMRRATVTTDAPADSLVLPAGGEHTIHLSVVPTSNDDDLVLGFEANGFEYVFKRDLSQFWSDLRNLAGAVDWAMALYDADRPFQHRSQGEERGWSFANGPGEDEDGRPVSPGVYLVRMRPGATTDGRRSCGCGGPSGRD